jgi:hypothetical protein
VLNIVHGAHDTVNNLLDHPDVRAISFVGSDAAGRYIYQRAAANGKRVQVGRALPDGLGRGMAGMYGGGGLGWAGRARARGAGCMLPHHAGMAAHGWASVIMRLQSNLGAKNHAVIMPDANVDSTVKALTGGRLRRPGEGRGGGAASQHWRAGWWWGVWLANSRRAVSN